MRYNIENSIKFNRSAVNFVLTLFAITVLLDSFGFAQTWVNTNGPRQTYTAVDLSIGKNATTGQKIYCAVDAESLKVSTNNGTTWKGTGFPTDIPAHTPSLVECDPNYPNKVFAWRLGTGMRYTHDGWNSSWPITDNTFSDAQRIVISAGDSGLAFTGTIWHDLANPYWSSLFKWSSANVTFEPIDFFKNSAHTYLNDIVCYPKSDSANYVWVGGSSKDMLVEQDETDEKAAPIKTRGVWKSTDYGINWTWKEVSTSSAENVTALAISIKSNSDRQLFAAAKTSATTNKVDIYRSTTMGETWEKISGNNGIVDGVLLVNSLKTNPAKPETLVASTDQGFAVSTNRGSTWNLRNSGLSDGDARDVMFNKSGDTVYLATFTSVYRSTNLGTSWTLIHTGTKTPSTYSVAIQSGTMNALPAYPGISTYTSGSWVLPPQLVGSRVNRGKYERVFNGEYIAINHNSPGYAYACGDSDGKATLYMRTSTSGSWFKKFNVVSSNSHFHFVVADPKTLSQKVYMGAHTSQNGDNFYYSTNYGNNWSSAQIGGAGNVAVTCIALDTSLGVGYSNTLYAGLGGTSGIYKSIDAGSTWNQKLSGYLIRSIAVNGKNTTTAQTVYAGGDDSLWKSTNGFGTKTNLNTPFTGTKRILMHPSYPNDGNHLWVITANGNKIYKTKNGGSSWDSVTITTLPKPVNDLRRDPTNDSLIYAATAGGVYKINPAPERTDTAWDNTNGAAPHPVIAWRHSYESDRQTYKIYKSVNGGAYAYKASTTDSTYTDASEDLDGSGTEKTVRYIVKVADNASTLSEPSNYVEFIVIDITDQKVRVNNLRELPADFGIEQNYPNPFNPITAIKYALPVDATVTLKIFDVSGREVVVLVNGVREAGYYEATFDAKKLASGMSLYRIISAT
jgi:hypothetical protein